MQGSYVPYLFYQAGPFFFLISTRSPSVIGNQPREEIERLNSWHEPDRPIFFI